MSQSENINELMTALSKAQGKMKPAVFNKINPHFKSKYADLASIWDAIRIPFSENGLSVIQTVETKEGYTHVMVTTLAHASGQFIRSEMPIMLTDTKPQALGSALTYYRRYALSAIAGVTADEDDDGNIAQDEQHTQETRQQVQAPRNDQRPQASPNKPISEKQIDLILRLCKGDATHICEHLGVQDLADLSSQEASKIIESLKPRKEAA